jgi:hypothetical protein
MDGNDTFLKILKRKFKGFNKITGGAESIMHTVEMVIMHTVISFILGYQHS